MIHEIQEKKIKEIGVIPIFYNILQNKPLAIFIFPFATEYPYVGELIIVRTIDEKTNVESKMLAKITSVVEVYIGIKQDVVIEDGYVTIDSKHIITIEKFPAPEKKVRKARKDKPGRAPKI